MRDHKRLASNFQIFRNICKLSKAVRILPEVKLLQITFCYLSAELLK